jgi:endonuclease-3
MNQHKRQQIFARLRQDNPSPKTELNYQSNYELLISVMLSAQATDVSVNKATHTLFKIANTPETMVSLGVGGLKSYIKSIGLYNTKASNIIKASQRLLDQHEGQVPATRSALEELPGVGRKTANVVLNTAFGQVAMAVDTHIFRWSNRTQVAPGKTVLAVERRLLHVIPAEFILDAHHWMILHGRYVCTARKPHCESCIIADLCEYQNKTINV